MALGSSSPVLQLCVQSGTTAAAVAAAAAAAAALAALTRPGGNSSSNSSGGGDGSSGGGGGGSRAHTPGPACAFLSSTANCKHAAVRQLLLQWRPAEWRAPLPRMGATALPHAAMLGAWPVVSELLRAGVDPRDAGAPATVLYLALVQGRGAMAAWLLVRLLACPFGVWKEVVGGVFAAFVTLMMGLASPLQLLPHHHNKPLMYLEKVLRHIGFAMVYILAVRELPAMFLHKDIADLVVVAAWLPVGC